MNKRTDIGILIGLYLVIKKRNIGVDFATFSEIEKYVKELKKEVESKTDNTLEVALDKESILYYKKFYTMHEGYVEINKKVNYFDFRLRFAGALEHSLLPYAYKIGAEVVEKEKGKEL